MDWIFWMNAFSLAFQGVLHLLFVSRFTGKKAPFWYFPVYLASLFAIDTVCPSSGPAVLLEALALYGLTRLQNGRCVSCVAAVLAVYASLLSHGIINSLEVLIFPYITFGILLTVCIIGAELAAVGACAACYVVMLRFFSLKDSEGTAWMLLPLGLFLPLNEFCILNDIYGNIVTIPSPLEAGRHLTLLVLQGLSLAALFSALSAYKRICRDFRTQAVLTALRQETHAQKVYVAEAQARYAQTQAFRHDIRNHLAVLAGLLKTNRINEAKDYMDGLTSIAAELTPSLQTGNPVVDVLLNDKLSLASSKGIRTAFDLTLPQSCMVDDLDWCILFANALDNAIQAASHIDNPHPSIQISGTQQGDFYFLEFENTRLDVPPQPPGTGLSNIKAAAKKYHGTMSAEADGSVFRLCVLLDISRPPENTSWQIP